MKKTKNETYIWPDNFPKGVPPEDSMPAEGFVFRMVRMIPPNENDFLPTREEYSERSFNGEAVLKSYGLSFFNCLEITKKKRKRFPPLRDRFIASGDLHPDFGKISKIVENHLTLWKQKDVCIHQNFFANAEAEQ